MTTDRGGSTLLYGWCSTNQHDTDDGRGPCPIQVNSAPPCRCACHGGDDQPRALLTTDHYGGYTGYTGATGYTGEPTTPPASAGALDTTAADRPADLLGETAAGAAEGEGVAEPASDEYEGDEGGGSGAGPVEGEAAAVEEVDAVRVEAVHVAAVDRDADDSPATLDLDGFEAPTPAHSAAPADPEPAPVPAAAPRKRPRKTTKTAFTRRQLHPGHAARTQSTPDGMFIAYLTRDDAPDTGWYIALPGTHVRFRKGKAVTLETRDGAFSGWRIGDQWVDRRTDQELTAKQDPLFDTDTDTNLEHRVHRLPAWAQAHMVAAQGPGGERGQRWCYELPVVELAALLVEAGDVAGEAAQGYLTQWRPTLFQQSMARALAGEQVSEGEGFAPVSFS